MRAFLAFVVFALSAFFAVPAGADPGPSDSAATDTAAVAVAATATATLPTARVPGKTRHFSIQYNMFQSCFEARFLPSDRWYIALVPMFIGEGNNNPDADGSLLPNLHFDQKAVSAYGYVGLLELNPISWVAMRGGIVTRDLLYFVEAGLRIRIHPYNRWAFELSAYPMQVSYRTTGERSNITLFQRSNMNLGLEFLF
jgi:hypothetical protein